MNTTLKGPAGPITTTQRVSIEFRLSKLELDFPERYRRGVAEVNDTREVESADRAQRGCVIVGFEWVRAHPTRARFYAR